MTDKDRQPGELAHPPVSMMVVLTGMMVVSALPLSMMGVLAAVIIPDLGITRSQLGFALSTVTAVGGILSISAGRFTDRVGGRTTLLSAFFLGALALGLVVVASSYGWLLVAMGIAGMMQSFSNPSTNWMIATHYPSGSRGLITGVKQSGVQFSLLLCGVALPAIVDVAGWRMSVAALMVIPLLGVAGALILPSDTPSRLQGRTLISRVRQPKTIWWLAAFSLSMGIGQSAVLAFVPLYANEEIGLGLAAGGAAGAVVGLLGVVSRIVWTRHAERFMTLTTPLGIITGGSLVSALCLFSASALGSTTLWIGVVAAGATMAASNAVVMLSTVVAAPSGTTGRASGLVIVFFLAGNSIGPAVFGWLADLVGDYRASWTFVSGAFAVALTVVVLWRRSEQPTRVDIER